jgi:predicted ATPase/DNA-binding winged helix-turn-helix (wHTH) protein
MSALTNPGAFRFLDFAFFPHQRRLERQGAPVQLSSRALDILRVLTDRPGEVVSKRDLLAEVWPHAVVDEGSIRFHMVALRRALGDGDGGAASSCIVTVPGRGYCFVGAGFRAAASQPEASDSALRIRLASPGWIVGRDLDVAEVLRRLDVQRCVSVVGAGGVGKSAVAAIAASLWRETYGGVIAFVDLSEVDEDAPDAVATVVAAALEVATVSGSPLTAVLDSLIRHPRLLMLDTCDAAIEGAAQVVAAILGAAPQALVLTTSREPLRVEGESVFRVKTLAVPPVEIGANAGLARAFPAVQLFVERAASQGRFELTDVAAPIVSNICRHLDGLPLAIEMAAGRVAAFGLRGVEEQLATDFALTWSGARTASPRRQTLKATLDWSFDRLLERERDALRLLAALTGPFSLEAALATGMNPADMMQAISELTAKSLLAIDDEAPGRYRMLEMTRTYARARSTVQGQERGQRSPRLGETVRSEPPTSTSQCPVAAGGTDDGEEALIRTTARSQLADRRRQSLAA